MPRPSRDYSIAIRKELQQVDAKLRTLALRRIRLQRMLADYESPYEVDLERVVQEVVRTAEAPRPLPPPTTTTRKRGRKR